MKTNKTASRNLARLLTIAMLLSLATFALPTVPIAEAALAGSAFRISNSSLTVDIGYIGQVEVMQIVNNRLNRNNAQPNFVTPNSQSGANNANHQWMGELIFSTRSAATEAGLASAVFHEQDINRTIAGASGKAGRMTQQSDFTAANLAANTSVDVTRDSASKVIANYYGDPLSATTARTMKGYNVEQVWDMGTSDGALLRTITIENVSDQYIEFGDVGMPMPWNNRYPSRAESYNDRMMVHNFAGADSGYTQIIRPSGEGNYIIFAPVPETGARLEYVEYWMRNFQSVAGYRANTTLFSGWCHDDGGWQPGLNVVYQHAKDIYWKQGGGYLPVSEYSSVVLAPGEKVSYSYTYTAIRAGDNTPQTNAESPNNVSDNEFEREINMRSVMYNLGMVDMVAVPSFTTNINIPTKLDLHYDDSRITDVQVEIQCVHENDPWDLNHVPDYDMNLLEWTGPTTTYRMSNARTGRGLHNNAGNAAYSKSCTFVEKKSIPTPMNPGGESHHIYELKFGCLGHTTVNVRYKLAGEEKYTAAQFTVNAEIDAVIDAHATYNYNNRQTTGTLTGLFREATMSAGVGATSASADDWGWDQGAFMAQKNLVRPTQAQITTLEQLCIDLYWGQNRVNHTSYQVTNNINSGSGHRVYTDQIGATTFFAMYNIMKAYPELTYRNTTTYPASWYLNIAYEIYNRNVVTSTGIGYYGEQFIEPLYNALVAEGMTTQASALLVRFNSSTGGKGRAMAIADYPYGSEFAFDNTGEEGAYFSAKALRSLGSSTVLSSAQLGRKGNMTTLGVRALENMAVAEFKTRACRGLQPTWYHYANVVFLGGEGWWNSQYTTPLAAAIMDDYLRFQNNGWDKDVQAIAERVNYAAKISAFSHVNMGQIHSANVGNISWTFCTHKGRFGSQSVNDQGGGRIQYNGWRDASGEADENMYGSLLRLSSDVVTDPVFGLFGYGCEVSQTPLDYTVTPKDGIGKKINFFDEKMWLEFNRDTVTQAVVAKNGSRMSFKLNNETNTNHTTTLKLDGLSTDVNGNWLVYINEAPVSGANGVFTVVDGVGTATIAMAADAGPIDLMVVSEKFDGANVGALPEYNYINKPIALYGSAYNNIGFAWTVEDAPVGALYSLTPNDDSSLAPIFTTDTKGSYTIRLTASYESDPDDYAEVTFQVYDINDFADPAITACSIAAGNKYPTEYSYQLTGAATTEIPAPDNALAYAWTSDKAVTFSNAAAASPTVTFPDVGDYVLTLTVTDVRGKTATQAINVTVITLEDGTNAPIVTTANIASGVKYPVYPTYSLTGAATTDIPGGTLTFAWTSDKAVTFSNAAIASPTVLFPEAGDYVLTLTVTDRFGRAAARDVNVTVSSLSDAPLPTISSINVPEVAPINGNVTVSVTAASGIPSGPLTYAWSVSPAIDGNTITGGTTASATLGFTNFGAYQVTVVVTDAIGRTVSQSRTTSVAAGSSLPQINLTQSAVYNAAQGNIARLADSPNVRRIANTTTTQLYTNSNNVPNDSLLTRSGIMATYCNTTNSANDTQTLRITDGTKGTQGTASTGWNSWGSSAGTTTIPLCVVINWGENVTVGSSRVEWYNHGDTGVPLPSSATIEYWTGTAWATVQNMRNASGTAVTSLGVANTGNWNGVTFDPVTTTRMRLHIIKSSSGTNGAGVSEWEIFGVLGAAAAPTADKGALGQAIAQVDGAGLIQSDYTVLSWANLWEKYDKAMDVFLDGDAGQSDVDEAAEALWDAINALTIFKLAPGQAPSFVIRKNMITQIKLETNTDNLTFTSSNTNIATVTQTGVVTGKSIGVAVIQIKELNNGSVINVVVNCTN